MADGRSTYLLDAELNLIFRNTAFSPLATVYVSAHTDDPGRTGANELTSGTAPGYSRKGVSTTGEWSAPADEEGGRFTSNINDILFDDATGDWPAVKYGGIWSVVSAGNFFYGGLIDLNGLLVVTGQALILSVGQLKIIEGSNLA